MLNSLPVNLYNYKNRLSFAQNPAARKKEPFIFIAMPMPEGQTGQKWQTIRDTIKNTARDCGADSGRIDDIMHKKISSNENTFVVHEIIKEIDNSDIVIADVSEKNPNVYFELGYAMGKGKKVIPIAKRKTDLPFDINSLFTIFYNQYFYKDPKEKSPGELSDLQKNLISYLNNIVKDWKNVHENEQPK